MTDLDEDYDDDWDEEYDDYLAEPNCYDCNDSGSRGYRACPTCRPSRVRHVWRWLTDPIHRWLLGRRLRRWARDLPDDPWAGHQCGTGPF